ncbi:MAG: GxxExxY protein [Prevotellaceae bacterium]|nr:GxxExxY protein [Prevotellaceae bacterium]
MVYEKNCYAISGCAFEVHKELGCGFLEEVYQEAMEREFTLRGIPFEPQKPLTIKYKGAIMNKYYIADLYCFGEIIVELKAVQALTDIHKAQVINYLKATGAKIGMLINFGAQSCEVKYVFPWKKQE